MAIAPPNPPMRSGTGMGWQLRVVVALQVFSLSVWTSESTMLVTYRVAVHGLMAMPDGSPRTSMVAGFWSHPCIVVALQVAPLMMDMVLSPELPTYTVLVRWSTVMGEGLLRTVIAGGFWSHPQWTVPLQEAPLTTETVLSLLLVT